MYIGIIGAMDEEINDLLEKMEVIKEEIYSNMSFYIGKLSGRDIVLAKCFVGKVNAAICTQTMILKYDIDMIINVGVAGGIDKSLELGDIAISTSTVEFDQNVSALGYQIGYTFGLDKIYIESDKKISNKLYEVASKENNVKLGVVASSDKFISSENEIKKIKEMFKDTVAVDMESASISHVCKLNDTRFCALRIISDSGNNIEYRDFVNIAVKKIDKIMLEFLKEI